MVLTIWAVLGLCSAHAADFHCATAQDLQTALTLAAANGAPTNNIYLTNGYYTGNFNYSSTTPSSLTLQCETNLSNQQISVDGGGTGRAVSLTSVGIGSITVNGITFLRNCGSSSIGALRIAAGAGATILVEKCQFLSPTNTSGIGLELASGLNATVTNCVVTGAASSNGPSTGAGMSISGVSSNVVVQNCVVLRNAGGYGGLYVSGASVVAITGNLICTNVNDGSQYNPNVARGVTSGGATVSGSTVTLVGNTFLSNTGLSGGASCSATTLIFSNNVFGSNLGKTSNNAPGGGAIASATTISLYGNIFTGNSVTFAPTSIYGGAGAYCVGPTIIASGNTFSNNSIASQFPASGGGLNCDYLSAKSIMLSNNVFVGNSATYYGGGFYGGQYAQQVSLVGNIFRQNTAPTGAGAYVGGGTLQLLDNLVFNNVATSAGSGGGGVWVNSPNLFMINNTVLGNTAYGSGGGVAFQVSGTVELLNVFNNIIWGNSAGKSGGDVWLSGTGLKKILSFNDVDSMYGVWDIAQNNIDVAPQFFDPVNGDYHLQSASPCRNAGTNGAPSLPLTDLDGNLRTNSAGQVDLGCYQFNNTATHPADSNGDFLISADEFNAYAAAWKSLLIWTNGPNPGPNPIPANYVTRAGYLMTNGGAYHNDGSARPTNWKIGR